MIQILLRFLRKDSARWSPLICVLLLTSSPLLAAPTYKYLEKDGTVWFTDHPPTTSNHKRFKFLGFHGRETATASCAGMNDRKLAARASVYQYEIRRYAQRYEVSSDLVKAIISVESCFDKLAVSRAGARGLMQLMPATAKSLGVRDVFNPTENIRAGIKYFSKMRQRFRDNIQLALAAYNAGPAAVEHYSGMPPFPETQRYVTKVMKQFKYYRGY